jgi:hypothetical protein
LPNQVRVLAPAHSTVAVTRLDANTLLIRPEGGFLLSATPLAKTFQDIFPIAHPSYAAQYGDGFFRSRARKFTLNEQVTLDGTQIIVTELTADGRPQAIQVQFGQALESASLRWLQWDWRTQAYVPFELPTIGVTIPIAGPF